jgi:hypothetical protein
MDEGTNRLGHREGSIMTESPGAQDAPPTVSDEDRTPGRDPFDELGEVERRALVDWVGGHLTYVRRTALGQRPLYWILALTLVVGLAADVGGYFIKASTTTGALGLVGDLLYTFGWALWTGVVVVVFVQIIPEAKRRQYQRALDTYEAARRDVARGRREEASLD